MKARFRAMNSDDTRDASDIEVRCDMEYPWTRHMIECQLKRGNTQGIVAVVDGEVAGFVVYRFDSIGMTILRLAVDPWHQRTQIGMALVNRVRLKCGLVTVPGGPGKVSMLVRETDDTAIRFLSKCEGIASLARSPFPSEETDGYRFTFDPIYANVTSGELF